MSDQVHFILGVISAGDESAVLSEALRAHLEHSNDDRHYTVLSHAEGDRDGIARILAFADGLIFACSAESGLTAPGRGLMRRASEYGFEAVLGLVTAPERVEPSRLSAVCEEFERGFASVGLSEVPVLNYEDAQGLIEEVNVRFTTPERLIDAPSRMVIAEVEEASRGLMVRGKVMAGELRIGDMVDVSGMHESSQSVVSYIEVGGAPRNEAQSGNYAGCVLRGLTIDRVQAGQVLTPLGESVLHTDFRAEVYCLSADEGGLGEWVSGSKPGRLIENEDFDRFLDYTDDDYDETEYIVEPSGERAQIDLNGVGVEGVVDLEVDGGILGGGEGAEARIRLSTPMCLEVGSKFTVYLGGDLIGVGSVSEFAVPLVTASVLQMTSRHEPWLRTLEGNTKGIERDVGREALSEKVLSEVQVSREIHSRLTKLGGRLLNQYESEVADVKFTMVYCPAGEFWMGTDDGGPDNLDSERPRHRVSITTPFLIGQTQVTQALWEAIMGSNPSDFKGANLPVERVNWFDCLRFCNALSIAEGLEPVYSIRSGRASYPYDLDRETQGTTDDEPDVRLYLDRTGYRLPTEAEWEYMAKAGTEFIFAGSKDIGEVAWHYDNSEDTNMDYATWRYYYDLDDKTNPIAKKVKSRWQCYDCSGTPYPVAQKKPNSWNIYDCSGNVWEWCSDVWTWSRLCPEFAYQGRTGTTRDPHVWVGSASSRVIRGGGWSNEAQHCRIAHRPWAGADGGWGSLGFRVLRCEP